MVEKAFDIRDIRCVHRHHWPDHKACFANGRIDYDFKDDRDFERKTGLPWWKYYYKKIGYFDIETTADFNADWGTVLTWCIKEKDGGIESSVITREELLSGVYDKRVVEEFVTALQKYTIIVGYYSDRFDMPFMRSKAMHYGIDFPSYGDLYHWDLYYTVRAKLKLSRRSLDNVCQYLGIPGKTPIDKDIWMKARYGDKKALEYVLEHNKGDVIITEKLHNKLEFLRKWLRKSI